MRFLKIGLKTLGYLLAFVVLTYVTQIGGFILLACIPLFRLLRRRSKRKWLRHFLPPAAFTTTYLLIVLLLLPPLAARFGRVPLPYQGGGHLKPLNFLTVVFNRHYVSPTMKATMQEISQQMNAEFPETVVAYMDAQFPFPLPLPGKGKSLPPHITHDDGRKLDVALLYRDKESGTAIQRGAPSWIGYGSYIEPLPGERDRPAECDGRGFKIYNLMARNFPKAHQDDYLFDQKRTQRLIQLIVGHSKVNRIYLEPHLVQRLGIKSSKTGLASCAAVRHDDHVHVQVLN